MRKPSVYVNKINKNIKNNKDTYHFKNDVERCISPNPNINKIINEMFNSSNFVYKSRVYIILKNGTRLTEDVIALKDNALLTLSDKKININDIADIKKAN